MPRREHADRALACVLVSSVVAAAVLVARMGTPAGVDHWTDGASGGLVWVFAGLVPAALAAVALAVRRAGQPGVRGVLLATTCVSLSTVVGADLRVRAPHVDGALAALGAGLDTVAVAIAVVTAGTLLRPRRARRLGVVAAIVGVGVGVAFAVVGDTTKIPDQLPAWALLQVPSLSFLGDAGETVLLLLGLGPVVAVGLAAWLFAEATVDERRRLRWLVLCLLIGLGVVTVMQLVRKLGLLDVADGFLAAFPRAIWWAAALVGSAATVADPRLGDAAAASRRVAVGVGLVSCVGAAGGLVWVAADATTAHIVPFAPALAAGLAMAALVLPVRDWLERGADRWLSADIGSDARVIDAFGAAAEHAGRAEVLELLVATARRALRVRWARASTEDPVPLTVAAGSARDQPAAATFVLMDGDERLGVLECGRKRGGPFNARDRQLLGALSREAALRLHTVKQADELAVRLDQIEHQAAEISASRARIVEAQDEERRRIERDIHDGVQQELASLTGKLRLAINQIAVAPDAAVATITGAQDDVRRTLGDVRSIAQGIHPAILDDQGIVPAIDARAKRLPMQVSLDVDPALSHRRFERRIEGAAYFLASEALANIVKHAEATEVTITLALQADCLSLTISDNGRGLTPGAAAGRGLTNMADRAAALGGSVSVRSDGAVGTTVTAELPLAPTVAS